MKVTRYAAPYNSKGKTNFSKRNLAGVYLIKKKQRYTLRWLFCNFCLQNNVPTFPKLDRQTSKGNV